VHAAVHVRLGLQLLPPASRRTLNAVDATALVETLNGERSSFVRMARARVATEEDAEDIVQRAMLRAAERVASLADPSRARPWFYRILRRAIVDHHRSAPAGVHVEVTDDTVATDGEGAPSAPTCRCAVRLMGELRPAYADILRRVDLSGEDPAAVASALGVSVSNLYVRLHRARGALRERVKGHCGVSSIAPCLECTCCKHERCGSGS
jgi:RNA polymerase sigma-70 factor (ECF subfamily)